MSALLLDLIIPSEAARNPTLTPSAKLLLAVILALYQRDGAVTATDAALGLPVGLASRTVRLALEQLYWCEWVERLGTEKRRTGLVPRSPDEQAIRWAAKKDKRDAQIQSALHGPDAANLPHLPFPSHAGARKSLNLQYMMY